LTNIIAFKTGAPASRAQLLAKKSRYQVSVTMSTAANLSAFASKTPARCFPGRMRPSAAADPAAPKLARSSASVAGKNVRIEKALGWVVLQSVCHRSSRAGSSVVSCSISVHFVRGESIKEVQKRHSGFEGCRLRDHGIIPSLPARTGGIRGT
jgi:hypothetical protein